MTALEDEIVIVGMFEPRGKHQECALEERRKLIRNLIKLNVSQRRVKEMWPRDSFVYHEGSLHCQAFHGNYADGGFLLNFPSLIMCSDAISEDEAKTRNSSAILAYRQLKLWRLYRERAEVLPSPNLEKNPNIVPHIDYVVLPIPQKKVIFVDEDYFIRYEDDVSRFCDRRGFRFETVYNDYENPSWPCNSLVLETPMGLTAFVNSDSDGRFIHSLESYGIRVVGLPFSNNCRMGGGIHCATNSVPRSYINSALNLFAAQ